MNTDLESRVIALERSNRRYQRFTLLIAAACAGLAIFGFGGTQDKVSEVVRTKKLEVVDSQNRSMAVINVLDGCGVMTTYNANGNILTDIIAGKTGAGGIVLYDGKRNQTVILADVEGGGGNIRLNNQAGQTTMTLGRNKNDAGSLMILNKNQKEIIQLTGDTDEPGAVLTYNNGGTKTGRLPADQ